MKKTKKILFPTDFSEPAANAFRYALLLADKMEADLEVLHIVFPEGAALDYPGMGAMLTQTKVESERIVLRKFIDNGMTQVLEQLKNAPNILTDIEVGTPVNDIVRVAGRDNADLIIMGSRGTNRNRIEQMLGSIAAGVVARAKCPVLVVPEHTPFKAPLAIAYASNVSGADPYELWKSLQLLDVFKPMIHLVHLNFNKEGDAYAYQEMQDMEAFLESRSPETEVKIHNLPGKDMEEDLNHFIKKENIDLLVMYQPTHNIWDRLFGKSATKEMAVHTTVPLLVMKK